MSKRVSVGDLVTVRGVEWIVDALYGDPLYGGKIEIAQEWRGGILHRHHTVTLDEIDSCEHEGRLLALIEDLYTLRAEIERGNADAAARMVTDMIHEAKGEQ